MILSRGMGYGGSLVTAGYGSRFKNQIVPPDPYRPSKGHGGGRVPYWHDSINDDDEALMLVLFAFARVTGRRF
jgi:hypothetical protein